MNSISDSIKHRRLSVIIPVASEEVAWRDLLGDLCVLPESAEIILVSPGAPPVDWNTIASNSGLKCSVRWEWSPAGRARQMNCGASKSSAEVLWFLHADSRINAESVKELDRVISKSDCGLYYFRLRFLSDGPFLTRLNAWGANLRSALLGLPFGDQGFCIERRLFDRLGGFDECAAYGEDHLFVWQAHREKIPVRRIPGTIATSARKYQQHGWLRTTLSHIWKTTTQAGSQLFRKAPLDQHRASSQVRLIVFSRCPDSGQCKTRLIPTLGEQGALRLHEWLAQQTFDLAKHFADHSRHEVEIRYTGENLNRLQSLACNVDGKLRFREQADGDLGTRLRLASETAFREGASAVILIGTDCPSLTLEILADAVEHLNSCEVVLGPASDGGYYLIATRKHVPELFAEISWGQSTVLQETVQRTQELRLTIHQLPILSDVDRPEDLDDLIIQNNGQPPWRSPE